VVSQQAPAMVVLAVRAMEDVVDAGDLSGKIRFPLFW
jgi:hypothetical protein